MSDETAMDAWAIIEVMGHRTYAGRVSERRVAGQGFIQIDIPETEGREATTKLLGTSSIFALHLTTEVIAREYAARASEQAIDAFARIGLACVSRPALSPAGYDDIGSEDEDDEFDEDDDPGGYDPPPDGELPF